MAGRVMVVTGTGTEVGKTVVTAALAALSAQAGARVAVVKAAQTGVCGDESGDVDEVRLLAGDITGHEVARYPEPLAPSTAARRSSRPPVRPDDVVEAVDKLAGSHDLVLVEGAGGLLVRYDERGATLADVAAALDAPVLVVAHAGLGTLNTTALTAEALGSRGLHCAGVVIGSWPSRPDLACRCNLADLDDSAGAPLRGALPEGAGSLRPDEFRRVARESVSPELGGVWDAVEFASRWTPPTPPL